MLLHVPRNVLQEDSIHYFSSYQSEAEWPVVAEIIILGSFEDEFDICLSLETSPSFHDLFVIFARTPSALSTVVAAHKIQQTCLGQSLSTYPDSILILSQLLEPHIKALH